MRTRTDRRKNVKTRGEFSPLYRPMTPDELAAAAARRDAHRKKLAATARAAFPNDRGNYTGKRVPTLGIRRIAAIESVAAMLALAGLSRR